MADNNIRYAQPIRVPITDDESTAEPICVGDFAGGLVVYPSTLAATTMTLWVAAYKEGPYRPYFDIDGTSVKLTVTGLEGQAHELPSSFFPLNWIKIVGDAVNEPIVLSMKS